MELIHKIFARWYLRITIFLCISILLFLPLYSLYTILIFHIHNQQESFLIFNITIFISLIFSSILVEKSRVSDKILYFGLNLSKWALKDCSLGVILAVISCIVFYLVALFGNAGITFYKPNENEILIVTLTIIFSAASEELIFRGIIFQAVLERFKPGFTIIFTSIVFSLLHSYNPYYSFYSGFNIALAGVLFAIMYIRTLSLWMPVIFHILWNWCQAFILGSPVSGYGNESALIKINFSKLPQWLSGGNFGIEGGFITTILMIGYIIIVIKYSEESPYTAALLFKRRHLESLILSK